MNKGRRNELAKLKYRKRIARFTEKLDIYIRRDGERIPDPKVVDIIKDNGQNCYRTTSTPCSCDMCSGHKKYNRAKQKRRLSYEYKDVPQGI